MTTKKSINRLSDSFKEVNTSVCTHLDCALSRLNSKPIVITLQIELPYFKVDGKRTVKEFERNIPRNRYFLYKPRGKKEDSELIYRKTSLSCLDYYTIIVRHA